MSSETREGRPDFLREAEERARRERTSVKAALAADRERLRTLPYPGPDCLDPEEIEQLSGVAARTPVWAEARLGHVEGCEDCATLLLMSEPGAVSLERMIAAVRVRIAEEPAPAAISRVREGRNRREPAWEALLGLGPLTLVLAVLWAWGTIRPDGLPGRVVSVMGWAAGVSVLVTLAAVGVSGPAAAWLGEARGTWAPMRFAAGALVGGLAAATVVLGLGLAGFRLASRQMAVLRESAEASLQSEALRALAARQTTGKSVDFSERVAAFSVTMREVPGGALYQSSLGDLGARSATLVARVTDSGGQVYWSNSKGGETVTAAQLFLATIVNAGGRDVAFLDSNGKRHEARLDPGSVIVPPVGSEVALAVDNKGRVTGLVRLPSPDDRPASAAQKVPDR